MKSIFLAILFFAGLSGNVFAHPSWAIVVDERNQIYLSDLTKIWKIDASGKASVFKEIHSHELTLDKDGNLFGEELNYNPATKEFRSALWKMTPTGQFSYILPLTTQPPKAISIWKNPAGATYYSGQTESEPREYFLLKRDARGNVKVIFGNERNALAERQVVPYSVGGMAFGADESVYFKSSNTIWKAAPNDTITVIAEPRDFARFVTNAALFGLTVDAENNVYTADYNSKKVFKISPDKRIYVAAESEKSWAPTGVYHKNENLYVMEYEIQPSGVQGAFRVRKIGADKKETILPVNGMTQLRSQNETSENSGEALPVNQHSTESSKAFCNGFAFLWMATAFLAKRK